MLSPLARSAFALTSLIVCLLCIGSAALAAVRKRYRAAVSALVLMAPVFFIWQILFDLSLHGVTEGASAVSRDAGALPWLAYLASLLALTVPAVLLLVYNIRYDRKFITPGAVKLFLDKIPCGVCCWRGNGRVLFSNICMNRLSLELTGGPLLNGNQFRDAARDGILTVDGRVWRFSCRSYASGGGELNEMIASDITNEYAVTEALEKEKEELSLLNRKLSEYYWSIDEAVRRREILEAKVNIHDEMNRLMLSTTAAASGDTKELDRIFSLWEQNALLLCMEADSNAGAKGVPDVEKLADALKIKLVRQGEIPDTLTEEQKILVFTAAKEATVNAVKHAGATVMKISFDAAGDDVICRFVNDGNVKEGSVRFKGGLANLASLASGQGAKLEASAGDVFTLTLTLPRKNQPIDGFTAAD